MNTLLPQHENQQDLDKHESTDLLDSAFRAKIIAIKSEYPISWNTSLRTIILERDFYKCVICYKPWSDTAKLHVHHINHNKQNCDDYNLVTLCSYCHSRAHRKHNVEYWKQKLSQIVGYKFQKTQVALWESKIVQIAKELHNAHKI
jgi:5-methylcytosine-specific restriction endonuclease McrA